MDWFNRSDIIHIKPDDNTLDESESTHETLWEALKQPNKCDIQHNKRDPSRDQPLCDKTAGVKLDDNLLMLQVRFNCFILSLNY